MMIWCLSFKYLNKIVDNICLYVFYINFFSVVFVSIFGCILGMFYIIKYCIGYSVCLRIVLMLFSGIGCMVVYM